MQIPKAKGRRHLTKCTKFSTPISRHTSLIYAQWAAHLPSEHSAPRRNRGQALSMAHCLSPCSATRVEIVPGIVSNVLCIVVTFAWVTRGFAWDALSYYIVCDNVICESFVFLLFESVVRNVYAIKR